MPRRKIVKRISGCFSKSSGTCQGPIVGHFIVKWGNQETRFEACAAHAQNLVTAALTSKVVNKGLGAFGIRFQGAPRFDFKYISRRR